MRLFLLLCMLVAIHDSYGQWHLNGSVLENQNSGDVIINSPSNLRTYGRIITLYPKSNTPLNGEFFGTSGWWGFRTDTDNRFHIDIYNANNPRSSLTIDQTGNVGIGTSNPGFKLHVIGQTGNSSAGIFQIDGAGAIASLRMGVSNDYAWLQSYGAKPLMINEIGNNTFLNPVFGNVGIGTTNPGFKFHVTGLAGNSSAGIVQIDGTGAIASLRMGVSNDYAWLQSHGSKPLMINELGNNTFLNPVFGNVGIGTTNPDAKLTVKGAIHTEEVRVDLDVSGPDYVFEKDYDLLSLSKLEAYINQNKHLPEVPSAKEMEENGMNLKEMNLLLLKKVEEVTLHLIEKDKQIKELSSKYDLLKQEITNLKN
jgi:hypothetical protein